MVLILFHLKVKLAILFSMFQIFIVLFNICTHLKCNTKFKHDPHVLQNFQTLTKQPMKISDDMNVSCFSSYSITIYFRYLGNPINDRVQFLRSSENLWSPEKGFISCDNKIGEKQFLFISAPRQDRHLPELL